MSNILKGIEILNDKVYIEFLDGDSGYFSYTKTKEMIRVSMPQSLNIECVENQKAINFLNIITNKYLRIEDKLLRKDM